MVVQSPWDMDGRAESAGPGSYVLYVNHTLQQTQWHNPEEHEAESGEHMSSTSRLQDTALNKKSSEMRAVAHAPTKHMPEKQACSADLL